MPDDSEDVASYPQQSSPTATGRSPSAGPPGAHGNDLGEVAGPRQHPAAPTAAGNSITQGPRVRRVLSAGAAVILGSFLLLFVPIIVYAFVLALRVRGLPDQTAINHFAAMLSPALMPWLERVLTPVLAFWAGLRSGQHRAVDGLAVGFVAGLLGLVVVLTFGGSLTVGSVVSLLVLVGLGWLGGLLAQRMSLRRSR